MKGHYKFVRGLGKEDIGIAVARCIGCKGGGTLYAVDDGKGNRVYACGNCKGNYKKHKKGG